MHLYHAVALLWAISFGITAAAEGQPPLKIHLLSGSKEYKSEESLKVPAAFRVAR